MKWLKKIDVFVWIAMVLAAMFISLIIILVLSGLRKESIIPKTNEARIVEMCQTYSFRGVNVLGGDTTFTTIDSNRLADCLDQAGFKLEKK